MAPDVVMQLQNRNIRVAVSLLNLFFVIKCHKEKDATEYAMKSFLHKNRQIGCRMSQAALIWLYILANKTSISEKNILLDCPSCVIHSFALVCWAVMG